MRSTGTGGTGGERQVEGILDDLADDGVYVHPRLESLVADDLPAIEAAVAESDVPIQVVVYPFARNDEFGGQAEDLLTRLHATSGEAGVYLSTTDQLTVDEYGGYRLTLRAWETAENYDYSDFALAQVAEEEHPDDLGAQLLLAVDLAAEGPDAISQAREALPDSTPDEGVPDWLGPTSLVAVLLALTAAVVVLARQLRATRTAPRLPAAVVERVRDARDSELRARADRERVALGEQIAASDVETGDDDTAWQAALDHHDTARRVLGDPDAPADEAPHVLDVVGALVLLERGRAALEAARAGRGWEPTRPCFLNPLHGAATARTKVTADSGRIDAPLCADCARALAKGRTPDVLDTLRRGQPVHYFETDREPWAGTGYGALHTDLVERLRRVR